MEDTFKSFHRVLSIAGISIFAKHNWNSKPWLFWQTFNCIIGILCFVFTTGFIMVNFSDFILCIEGACIWTTGLIMTITLVICLTFRNNFRNFLNEMAFKDGVLEMPLIQYILLAPQKTPKLSELKDLVLDSQEKLLKYTRVLLITYQATVFLCVTLYLCNPIYQIITKEDDSERVLGN